MFLRYVLCAAALTLAVVRPAPVTAGENPRRPAQETKKPQSEVDTEDLFGFTTGSDIGDPGDLEGSVETKGRFGRRGDRYHVFSPTLEAEYTPAEQFKLAFAATFDRYAIRNVPDLENRDTGGLSQLSTALSYRLLKRDPSPVGLTLTVEPQLGFLDQDSGERARRTAVEARLSLDAALVPERLFGAVNLIYEAERVRPRALVGLDPEFNQIDALDAAAVAVVHAPSERESTIGISGALAFQVVQDLFLGAETRYLRKYEGLDLGSFQGHALFVGPTLYAKLSERVSLSAAWNVQVTGAASDKPGNLDLQNFEHHQAKVKLSVTF